MDYSNHKENSTTKSSTTVSSGNEQLDSILCGGYEKGVVTTIFGPSGSGKTNLCLMTASSFAKDKSKVVIIDTEGGIAAERIKQLAKERFLEVLENILFLQPLTFKDQILAFEKLRELVEKQDIKLIIVDSIAMLYRLELGKPEQIFETNSQLARQIACLVEIARKKEIPVVITNQVYSDFNNRNEVKMVGGDLLKYGSKCLIELKSHKDQEEKKIHELFIRKHRFITPAKKTTFVITKEGIEVTKE